MQEAVEVGTTRRIIYQILNVMFILGTPVSSTITYLIFPTLSEQGDNERLISPAGWAFSIWGVIYSLLAGFTVYQAIPGAWISNRNDDLIFNWITYAWWINMIS